MKKIFLLLLLISGIVTAQNKDYKHSLSGIKKVRLETNTRTKITVGTTNSLILKNYKQSHNDCDNCDHEDNHDHEIVGLAHGNHKDQKKTKEDKRKGLTAIYPGGKDNTNGFGFSVEKEGDLLIVRDLKSHFQRHGIQLELPKNINISVDTGTLGNIEVEGFTSEVEANTNVGRITMKDVTGPITAHSSTGAINIAFSKVNQSSPITVSSSVSEIDVAIPATTKANLEIKTNGTVYTNFDIKIPTKKGMKNISGAKKIQSTINNGGVKIRLKSSMGNIYLRKK